MFVCLQAAAECSIRGADPIQRKCAGYGSEGRADDREKRRFLRESPGNMGLLWLYDRSLV